VRCVFAVDEALPTCVVVILVNPSGERTMLSDRGANAALRPEDLLLDDAVNELRGVGTPHLHLSGYVLLDPSSRAAGLAALARARARGWTTSVDPQSAELVAEVGTVTFLDWVRGVDLLLPNEIEARALGGPESILDRVDQVVVTYGAHGARWLTAESDERAPHRPCGASTRRAPATPSTPGCSPAGSPVGTRRWPCVPRSRQAARQPPDSAHDRGASRDSRGTGVCRAARPHGIPRPDGAQRGVLAAVIAS
jgi:hypothetical protein